MKRGSFIFDGINSETVKTIIQTRPVIEAPLRRVDSKSAYGLDGDIPYDEGVYDNTELNLEFLVDGDDTISDRQALYNLMDTRGVYKELIPYFDPDKKYRVRLSDKLQFQNDYSYGQKQIATGKFTVKPYKYLVVSDPITFTAPTTTTTTTIAPSTTTTTTAPSTTTTTTSGTSTTTTTTSTTTTTTVAPTTTTTTTTTVAPSPSITGSVDNPTNYVSQPLIKVTGSGQVTLTINGVDFNILNVPGTITLDSERYLAYQEDSSGIVTSMNNQVGTREYPVLNPGNNDISVTGSVTQLYIEPRWRSLV